ncbi:ABC transporter permease [Fulvivirga lutimaris]|uniref:ABC transporter permease n=1 Tax=Fulvivirga lutimaris TaxID=1819566 RepID=UPI0012BCCDF1|nr:ABC transporter permease [Fulvivirga lutimaris]MTI41382.1 FtsX-like permease family protein [Fulvivirga lutimaris]
MLKNYIRVTVRNLFKNSVYSFINITGLAVGIVCCILILLWVNDEVSYDKFLPKYNKLAQVWINAEFDGKINSWTSVPLPTYEAMKTADTKIKNSCVTGWGSSHLLTLGEKRITNDGYWVSEEFLEMFEFPMAYGDPSTVLDEPSSIVLTESFAKSLFGDEDPLDKIIRLDDEADVKVTGILKDVPSNSSFEFEYLIPWKLREQLNPWVRENKDNWGNNSFQVFIELDQSDDLMTIENNVKDMLVEHSEPGFMRYLFLHPVEKWRLYSNFENGVATGGRSDYVQLFTVIALLIIAIACINFMNLATARSERRAREVGIRKSVGSGRGQLIAQFIGESVFISLISYVVAILLSLLLLPFYNNLVEKELFIDFTSPLFWIFTAIVILVTGIISGSYPAFYLSSFRPAKVLKGKVTLGKNASTPRQVLVILQFGVSIILIIGTIVIIQQIKMAKDRALGYDQEKLISIDKTGELSDNYDALKTELLQSGAVAGVTVSNSKITSISSNNFLGWPGKPDDLNVIFTTITTEYDYCQTMGIEVLMGRDFSKDFKSDTAAIIINKAGLDLMGLEDPIGTQLDLWGSKRELIGVVDNVLMGSVYSEVKPLFMIIDDWGGSITVRLSGDIQNSLATVKSIFEKHNPAYPFEYDFVDVDYQKKFTTINMTSRLANLFAILTIFITGLGLFGLAAYTAEQRTKEIGIRKVLGASVGGLIQLMSYDFSKLVIISFLLSSPLAWYLLNSYLERYPLRTEIMWWIFPLTGLIALIFAIAIVSTQALKAATANPVKSLRNE